MSPTVHMIVGSITLVLFIVNAVMYAIEMARGKAIEYHRLVSFGAATALLLQYALGFMLLGAGNSIKWTHYVFALLAILPVGMEHGMAAKQTNFRKKSMIGMIASILAVVLVFGAYYVAESR